ncbi:unnamed protein product [Urochloa humidicola]
MARQANSILFLCPESFLWALITFHIHRPFCAFLLSPGTCHTLPSPTWYRHRSCIPPGQRPFPSRSTIDARSFKPRVAPTTPVSSLRPQAGALPAAAPPTSATTEEVRSETTVMDSDHRSFIEIVLENGEDSVQSWHLDGHSVFVVGMDVGTWSEQIRDSYNLVDAVSRCILRKV